MPFLNRNSAFSGAGGSAGERELFTAGPHHAWTECPGDADEAPAAAGTSLPPRQPGSPEVQEGALATILLLRWDIFSWLGVGCRAWPSPVLPPRIGSRPVPCHLRAPLGR